MGKKKEWIRLDEVSTKHGKAVQAEAPDQFNCRTEV